MTWKFEQVLSKHFEQEEILELENRPDYESTKMKIEQLHADDMLTQLEAKINAEIIDKTLSLDERFKRFQQSVGDLAIIETGISELNPKEYIATQKKEMRENFLTTVSGGKNPDITKIGAWKWMLGVWAFEQIENWEKLDKNSSWIDKITTWAMSKIWITLLSMLWFWKAFAGYKSGRSDIQLPVTETPPETTTNVSEKRESRKYSWATLIFLNIINRENNTEVFDNLSFQNLTFTQLFELKKGGYHNQQFNDYMRSFPKNSYNKQEIISAIDVITTWKWFNLIEDIFEKSEYKNEYKTFSVKELFLHMWESIELLGSVQSQNILTQASSWDFKNMDDDTKKYLNKRSLSENIFSLARDGDNYRFDNDLRSDTDKSILNKLLETDWAEQPEEAEKIENLVNYWYKIQSNLFLKEDGRFQIYEEWETISNIFQSQPLSLKEVVTLRVITWEVTQLDELNSIQQSALYLWLIWFLQDRWEHKVAWNYFIWLWEWCTDKIDTTWRELSSKIPQWVKDIGKDVFEKITNEATAQASNMAETLKWMIQEAPLLWAWAWALLLFWPWFIKRQSFAWMAFWK